eukprot:6747930-Alexandrium_andersonii.AAC.1
MLTRAPHASAKLNGVVPSVVSSIACRAQWPGQGNGDDTVRCNVVGIGTRLRVENRPGWHQGSVLATAFVAV